MVNDPTQEDAEDVLGRARDCTTFCEHGSLEELEILDRDLLLSSASAEIEVKGLAHPIYPSFYPFRDALSPQVPTLFSVTSARSGLNILALLLSRMTFIC